MVEILYTGDALWDRIERAVQKVKDRLDRVSKILDASSIPYAVIGGNAAQVWVSQVDESAVRNTRDVDIVIQRERLADAITALEQQGFIYRHVKSIDMFLDGPDAKARDAVHVVFAGERVRETDPEPVPSIDEAEVINGIRTISFEALVRMKLTSYRDKDRTHIRDFIDVGLLDATWPPRLPKALGDRLQLILDDPLG